MNIEKPLEGHWYSHRSDEAFFVIAVHDTEELIDVRDSHGDVDEFNFEEWEAMGLALCSAPELAAAESSSAGGDDGDGIHH